VGGEGGARGGEPLLADRLTETMAEALRKGPSRCSRRAEYLWQPERGKWPGEDEGG